jgi:hypothetical protein
MRARSLSTCILAVALSLCTGAAAQNTGQAPSKSVPDFTPPRWPSPPVPSDDYPEFAGTFDLKGAVTLNCLAKVSGRLGDCRIARAVPRGLGFEQQALRDAATYTITPAQTSEGPVERRIEFTVNYALEEPYTPQPWKGPKPTPEQLQAAKAMVSLMLSEGTELPEQDLDQVDLSDLDADLREKVQAILAERPMPKVENERLTDMLSAALALVLAKHGYANVFEVPLKEQDQFFRDGEVALASLATKHIHDETAWISQVRNDFCAVHDCGPQD